MSQIETYEEAKQLLEAYKNTGLTPDEIFQLKDYHAFESSLDAEMSRKVIELAEAWKDGRVVIIPEGNYTFTLTKG